MKLVYLISLVLLVIVKPSILIDVLSGSTEVYQDGDGYRTISSTMVRAPAGIFLGSTAQSRGGKLYFLFQGIPYAEKPGRFQPSFLKEPLKEIYDASFARSQCAQLPSMSKVASGSEDCLFLNIHAPLRKNCEAELSNGQLLPVLLWIHPGTYQSGNGTMYKGTYLLDNCIVMVTINYRLGPLGFLTTEDDILPGNLGLKDQVVAMKWVQKNIMYFKGDPNRVTIGGTSAGASSVSHHICSPASKGLFARAIYMSSAVLNPWAITKFPRRNAFKLGKAAGCVLSKNSSQKLRACLLKKSINDIVEHQMLASENPIPFTPTIEPADTTFPFQTRHPYLLLKHGEINRVQHLTGFTQDEGIFFGAPFLQNPLIIVAINALWNVLVPIVMFYDRENIPIKELTSITNKIRCYYFGLHPVEPSQRQQFTNMISDRFIVQGIYETAQLTARHSPVFLYMNSYKGGASTAQSLYNYKFKVITHLDDEQYLFPMEKYWPYGTEQYEYSLNMIELWINFMKTGKPSGRATAEIPWKPLSRTDPVYSNVYNLDFPTKVIQDLWKGRTEFWRNLGLYPYEYGGYNFV